MKKRLLIWLLALLGIFGLLFGLGIAKMIGGIVGDMIVPPTTQTTSAFVTKLEQLGKVNSDLEQTVLKINEGSLIGSEALLRLTGFTLRYSMLIQDFNLMDLPSKYKTIKGLTVQNITLRKEQVNVFYQFLSTGKQEYLEQVRDYDAKIQDSARLFLTEYNRLKNQ